MAIRELDKIPTKALMARITAELEGLIVTDADGRYIYVNHRWSSLTGYTLDQVKGRYVRDIVRNSRVDEVLKSQKFVSGDAVLLNICTNEEVPVYCSYTPLFHDGEIEGCFVYMIPKSEHTSMTIPPNVVTLMEALNQQLLILTKNSAQVNSLWLIFPASFITLVVVSLLTKKDNVKPVSDKGPDAVQLEILKAMKRGYTNAGAIITSMTQYSNDHELQAGHIHTALDSLEKSGYVTRKGQRLIAQLYFSLTEKGEATAVAHMGASELDTIAKYGVDTRALEFMQWIKSGDVSLSDISGKHSIYMMELSAISEHLSELGLVNVFGQGRLKASLTDAGQKLLQK